MIGEIMAVSDAVKLKWKDKEYRALVDKQLGKGLEEGGFRVLTAVQVGIQVPGRGKLYDHPTAGRYRASKVGQALKSPTGDLLNSMQLETGRIQFGLGARIGIGPGFARFAVIGREMMLGRNARVVGQRPTLRPALEQEFPGIVKMFQRAAKEAS